MTAKIHLPTPRDTSVEWPYLAEHIRTPRRSWMDAGLPRLRAIEPEPPPVDDEPDTVLSAHVGSPHPAYVGVYLERLKPRRYCYAVGLPGGREIKGYGFPSPSAAAKAYDRVCIERGVNLDLLNFGRQEAAG